MFRSPRCHGIYRQQGRHRQAATVVDGVTVRGKLHRPPNSYDDIFARAMLNRNWKRFRRTRWKP